MSRRQKVIAIFNKLDHSLKINRDFETFADGQNHDEFCSVNKDSIPLSPERRTWGIPAYISFWAVNNLCISNWQVGSSFVARGTPICTVMASIVIARCIIAAVAVLNGWIGSEYHIGYASASRCTWGIYGYYIALAQRVVLGIVWMGVQSWTGGICVSVMISSIFPSFQDFRCLLPHSGNVLAKHFIGFIIYCLITALVILIKPEKSTKLFACCNAINFATLLGLGTWTISQANNGLKYTDSEYKDHIRHFHGGKPPKLNPDDGFWTIAQCVSVTIGSIAVGLTTQPDYNRYSRNVKAPIYGQVSSIMIFGTLVPLLGCFTTNATKQIFSHPIWLPPVIVQTLLKTHYTATTRAGAFFVSLGMAISQLSINTLDNTFSVGLDLTGMFPRYINLRRGSYLSLAIMILIHPWVLMSSGKTFINAMSGYAVFLGPITGIMICDYWLVRRRKIRLSHLYLNSKSSIYWFYMGINWRTLLSWCIPLAFILPGFIGSVNSAIGIPLGFIRLYTLAYVYGLLSGAICFYVINRVAPPQGLGQVDSHDIFGTFTPEEAQRLGMTEVYKTDRIEEV